MITLHDLNYKKLPHQLIYFLGMIVALIGGIFLELSK